MPTTEKLSINSLWEYDVVWYQASTADEIMDELDQMGIDYTVHFQGKWTAISLASTTGKAARRR